MRYVAPFIIFFSLITPLAAEEEEKGRSLMSQGAELFMRGLLQEMEPAIDEFTGMAEDIAPMMQDFAENMGPAMRELLQKVDDFSRYEAPELLPNGDIIIRRKPDAPPLGDIEI